jgi:hypothetical protein
MGLRGSWYSSWVTSNCRKASMPNEEVVEEELVVVVEVSVPRRLLT